jgi:hypothetical protein
MDRIIGDLGTSGFLEIWKVTQDGEEECVYADQNTIVSGMGVGLAFLFGGLGANSVSAYQIRNAQLGTDAPTSYGVETFSLGDELTRIQYNTSSLIIEDLEQIKNGSVPGSESMIFLPLDMIRRVSTNSVQWTLTLDTDTANDVTLNEIGLLMRNPTGSDTVRPILVAYKTFPNITKKEEFHLIFKWTISF